ncbi:AsmA family protein [Yersinia kristensenii]|uniref:AsmA family protein n=1 Tax=Yersinia kristensenii TaxID=28152 RepID=UPI0005E3FB84|nr:AsmA family protein [Yersinia kristensenii]MDA5473143.1 AsmA family protein [Yersinia kristensenii]MDA5477784.1 AsmA family protein [Yersinia kristensenii]MDA5507509.1 AsmA family protein [Yersinia kristensenii]MDR4897863.1 AsmA family protein [Yersinia kristensenii]MDX6734233.1 AsmA family protein [Yersinia kristensenii]
MTKTGKVLAGIGGVIVLLLAAVIVFIMTFDWNRLKPTINEKVSTELQRPFAIRGNLGVDWSRKGDEPGWRGWVPWPHIHAEDLVLGNPANLVSDKTAGQAHSAAGNAESTAFPTGEMVTLKRVDASIAPLALLTKEVWIPRIWLTQPDAHLLRLANGENNWTFNLANSTEEDKSTVSDWSVNIDDIVFDRGQINLKDAVLKADLQVVIDPLGKPLPFAEVSGARNEKKDKQPAEKTQNNAPDFVFGWKVDGKYQGQPLTGSGKIGGMLSMSDANTPFPLQADVRSGSTRVAVAGTLTDPGNLAGLDLQLKFSGASLDNLYPLIGVLLPATPPYNTDGRLIASLKQAGGAVYRYENFNGKIGDSDIHGNLAYTASQPRPKLTGNMSSDKLRFADLAPLIGADSNQEKANRGERSRQPSNKVLPTEKFDTKSWGVMDADVTYAAKRIDRDKSLPLTDLSTHVVLNNGELRLDPLRFGMAGGDLNAALRLNGNKNPMQGKVDLHARRLQLKELLPQVQAMRNSLGQLNGDASFTASGNSVAALLATSNGHLRLLLNQGLISRSLMELLGLNVGNYLVAKLFGDDEVKINCAVADLQLRNGLATPRLFVIDTENAIINITGNINFATERLDLSIDPESKGLRILTLRSPLYVKGTFKRPDAGVKAAPLLARGAVAAVLGVALTPAAAFLALISPSEAEENQCTPLLQKMKQKK